MNVEAYAIFDADGNINLQSIAADKDMAWLRAVGGFIAQVKKRIAAGYTCREITIQERK